MRVVTMVMVAALMAGGARWSGAQGFIDQAAAEAVLEQERRPLDDLPDVYYEYFVFGANTDNSVVARNSLFNSLGDGDTEVGSQRARLISLLTREKVQDFRSGDTLVVPTKYDVDFRAYSPFPRYYTGARHIDKLFIIHKTAQAWAAYEYGRLARWGPVNTGAPESPTPTGRFNFNWREEQRISTLSPPDEPWVMRWVFNFHHERGIHIHQYEFPTGGPTSHGCVRLIDADARWVYDWADAWQTTQGSIGPASARGTIIKQGTMVLVTGDDPEGAPEPFIYKSKYPILRVVDLPNDPFAVPPGSPQQRVRADLSLGLE